MPYVIEDADGAVAMALIYVPAGSNGLPFVVDGKTIKMGADSTVKVSLADYVSDPRGGRIAVTSPDTVSTSPADNLQSEVTSATELSLTSTGGYVGPAALMLQVTNSTGQGDKAAQTAYVTVPVQVGPDIPVLRCPDHEVLLAADGPARTFDIARLCKVWWPTGLDEGTAQFEASWDPAADRVDLSQQGTGGRQVVLQAQPAAQAGTTGAVTIRAKGSAESFKVRVRVTSSPPAATLRGARIEGLVAGTSRTVNLAQYLDSPLTDPQCAISRSAVVSGTGITACHLRLPADGHGDRRRSRRGPRSGLRHRRPRPRRRRRRGRRHPAQQARRHGGTDGGGRPGARRQRAGRLPTSGLRRRSADLGLRGDGQRPRRRPQLLPGVPVHHRRADQR